MEASNLYLLDKGEWVTGPGASVVIASFTHTGQESRFSAGQYGVYYAALDEETAVVETVFHRERFLRKTSEAAIVIDMRCYRGKIQERLDDIRGKDYEHLSDPDISAWKVSQRFGAERRESKAFGLLYNSARHEEGECVAAFRVPR